MVGVKYDLARRSVACLLGILLGDRLKQFILLISKEQTDKCYDLTGHLVLMNVLAMSSDCRKPLNFSSSEIKIQNSNKFARSKTSDNSQINLLCSPKSQLTSS